MYYIVFCMENYNEPEHLNVGTGDEVSIRDLAKLVGDIVGFRGEIEWDTSKADGTPRKLMNSEHLRAMGWKPRYSMEEGIRLAYKDFESRYGKN